MDLREILREHGVTYTDGHVENAMKEAIRQALELACERVYCNDEEDLSKSIMSIMDEL